MYFKFEKIIVWKLAMEMGEKINFITQRFPKREQFNLSSQALRAADSIALNITEGSISQSNAEFRKFMGYAIRSLAELITCIHKVKMRAYISEKEFNNIYADSFELMNKMAAFRRNIR